MSADLRREAQEDVEPLRWLADTLGWTFGDPEAPVGGTRRRLRFSALPNARRPKALVPVGPGRVARTALRSFNDSMSQLARLRRAALGEVLRFGLDGVLRLDRAGFTTPVGGESPELLEHLERIVGRPVQVAVSLVPVARPNRKPVLQVLDDAGTRIGFAKVGWNDLTKRLVAAEASAISALGEAGLRELEVPRLLHAGAWRDRTIVLVSSGPSPLRRRGRRNSPATVEAEREVSETGWSEHRALEGSGYLEGLRRRVAAGFEDPSFAGRISAVLERVAGGHAPLAFGAWHGDWAPWNMSRLGRRPFVWDWERYGGPVPFGFDRAHLRFQLENLVHGRPVAQAATRAGAALRDVVGADAPVVLALYLVERVLRLEEGRAAGVPVRAGVDRAIVELLEARP